jgi:tetraprenyl-beta-curcumene synthase
VSAFDDRRLLVQAHGALVLANARYWLTVAPLVRAQLERYKQHAQAIRDPVLQALALEKLSDQRFHAQVAATLATLAPRAHRKHAVQAIVATEVIYDYLDALTEQPVPDPLGNGRRLSQTFTDAISIHREPTGGYYALNPQSNDCGYLETLVGDARGALARLPATDAIAEVAEHCAPRFAEAQIRAHAATSLGNEQLKQWATRHATGTTLSWFEFFAGATSTVLGLHALIAAAANPRTTPHDAAQIDALYLYTGVIVTMLDSVIDYDRDMKSTGKPGYARYYKDPDQLLQGLTNAARQAMRYARTVPNAAHHIMTLVGVVAFYTSAPTATNPLAAPVTAHIQRELRPLITPTLSIMRTWRRAKQLRLWWHGPSAMTTAARGPISPSHRHRSSPTGNRRGSV